MVGQGAGGLGSSVTGGGGGVTCSACGDTDPGDTLSWGVNGSITAGTCVDVSEGAVNRNAFRDPHHPCNWITTGFTFCGQAGSYWVITYGALVWMAELLGGVDSTLFLSYSVSAPNCNLGPVTLNKTSETGCTGPATGTLT